MTNPVASIPTTTAKAVAQADSQGVLQPGDTGFWKVWGASVQDIQVGDLVYIRTENGPVEPFLVQDTFVSKAAPLRFGFVSEGERFTLGALVQVLVLRWETHNTLAKSVR